MSLLVGELLEYVGVNDRLSDNIDYLITLDSAISFGPGDPEVALGHIHGEASGTHRYPQALK